MNEAILKTLVEGFTKVLFEECKSLFGEMYDKAYDELSQYIGTDLRIYLNDRKKSYSKIKTLLRGNTPVDLYSVYFPTHLMTIENRRNLNFSSKRIEGSIREIISVSNHVSVIGTAGSGKSTLIKHLFLDCLNEKIGIPILIELRHLNFEKKSFDKLVKEIISFNRLSQNEEILERLLKSGKFVFFFDGYDEIVPTLMEKVTFEITKFQDTYKENCFVLTSRPYSNAESLPNFVNIEVCELSDEEVEAFIRKQFPPGNILCEKIVGSVKENSDNYLSSFMKNPLLLSLYILTFQFNADIPEQKHIFYRRVIDVLFSEHDSKSKMGFVREKRSKLTQFQLEQILKIYSYVTYFRGDVSFTREYALTNLSYAVEKAGFNLVDVNHVLLDLKLSVALWVDDDGLVSYSHRSIQEYFAAVYVANMSYENKLLFYQRLMPKLKNYNFLSSAKNFLELVDEIDELDFTENYKLPLLRQFLSFFENTTLDSVLVDLVNKLTAGMQIQVGSNFDIFSRFESDKLIGSETFYIFHPIFKAEIYKGIYVYGKHLSEIVTPMGFYLTEDEYNELDVNSYEIPPPENSDLLYEDITGNDDRFIYFHKGIPDFVMEGLRKEMNAKHAYEIINNLRELKDSLDKNIRDRVSNDRELLDLI